MATRNPKSQGKAEAAGQKFRVGEIARLSGISVRALRHYDSIGLLCPSARTESGYRLYSSQDVARLASIKSLRALGFSLKEARVCLSHPDFSALQIVEAHLERVEQSIAQAEKLRARLQSARKYLRAGQAVQTEDFLLIVEAITMFEKHYTPEQMAYLEERRQAVGEERIQQVEAEWPPLMDEVRAAVESGEDPSSEHSQALAKRWNGLVAEFTGGDAGIHKSLSTMYESETQVHGMDVAAMQPLFEFIQRASQAAR